MEKLLREDEIATMHQLSNLTLSLTKRISELRRYQSELRASYNRVGLTFEYGSEDNFETPRIDILIDVSTGSNPNPLKTAWYDFVKKAIEEIEKELDESFNQLNEIKDHYKKM